MKQFFATLLILTFPCVLLSSEPTNEPQPSFCVKKFCHLVKERVNPNSKTSASKLEKNIEQVLIDCKSESNKLFDESCTVLMKEGNLPALEHVFSMKFKAKKERDFHIKSFGASALAVSGAVVAGYFFGKSLRGSNESNSSAPANK